MKVINLKNKTKISHSMVTTPIEDKLISPKQVDYFYAKRNEIF